MSEGNRWQINCMGIATWPAVGCVQSPCDFDWWADNANAVLMCFGPLEFNTFRSMFEQAMVHASEVLPSFA
jgi:hypothetical protein